MNILQIHNFYRQAGGEDFVANQDASLLEQHGHRVFRFTESNARIDEMTNLELLADTFWNKVAFEGVRRAIKDQSIDVVHVHNCFPILSPSVFSAASSMNVPVVFTLHNYRLFCINGLFLRGGRTCEDCPSTKSFLPGIWHRCYRDSLPLSAVAGLSMEFHRLRRTILDSVDRFVVLGDEPLMLNKLEGLGIPRHLMMSQRNYLLDVQSPGDGGNGGAVFVGRLAEEKGVRALLDAWKLLPPGESLHIIGAGPLESLVTEAASQDSSIVYHGWLQPEELTRLMAASRLFLLPSIWYETDAIVLKQAHAAGTPVLLSDVCLAQSEIVESGVGWTFRNEDTNDFVQKLKQIFALSKEEMGPYRVRSRKLFDEKFGAEQAYKRLIAIYESAGEHRRSRPEAQRNQLG